jgi:methyltransferase (TIGR00027 family)
MKADGLSRTARLVAACRALADPALCVDPVAIRFADDDALALARSLPKLITGVGLRTRYIDQAISGFEQVVLLGAGLDARPSRFPGATYFAIDLPRMIELRRSVFDEHAIAVDLTTQPFEPALRAHAAFDPSKHTVVVWEGVTYYLPKEAVRATLRQIRSLAPARFVFDYVKARWVTRDEGPSVVEEHAASWGEPMIFGVDDLPAFLASEGFTVDDDVATEELLPRYGWPRVEKRWYTGRMVSARPRSP